MKLAFLGGPRKKGRSGEIDNSRMLMKRESSQNADQHIMKGMHKLVNERKKRKNPMGGGGGSFP